MTEEHSTHEAALETEAVDSGLHQSPAGQEIAGESPGPEVIGIRRGSFGAADSNDVSGFGGLVEPIMLPAPATKPYGGWFDEFTDEFELALQAAGSSFEQSVERVVVEYGEITYFVHREHLRQVATTLRDDPGLRFELLSGVSGVHYPHQEGRELHSVCHFLSITHNRRIRVETTCPDEDPHIPSLVPIYPTADWHERETYDMFGIIYDDHPSMTRILMPDDWAGHPQRKDYSLNGIPVEYKGASTPPPNERRAYN